MKYSPVRDFRVDKKKVVDVDNIDKLEFNVYRIWYKLPDETRPPVEISTD